MANATAILHHFGFCRVLTVNGALCAFTLLACRLLQQSDPEWLIYIVLLTAGMARSMNFTSISTLAFADVSAEQRLGAGALATMLQQVAMSMGVAFAALALSTSQTLRGAPTLQLADFRHAWFAVSALMALAAAGSLRLDHHTGTTISSRRKSLMGGNNTTAERLGEGLKQPGSHAK